MIITADVSIDHRQHWTNIGSTTATGIIAFSGKSIPVSPAFWIRIGWNNGDTLPHYLYLAGMDFGDACLNHRLRKVELGLRKSDDSANVFLDDLTVCVEPIAERIPYFTVSILVEREAHYQGGSGPRRSVYKQLSDLTGLVDEAFDTLEPPTQTVTLEDPFGQKWSAMMTNIKEQGMLLPSDGPPGTTLEVEFMLLEPL